MSSTKKNLLLVISVSAVVIPGVFFFYIWSARVHAPTERDIECFQNLRQIDTAEQEWAMLNHKTTNDTPTWENLKTYLGSTNFKCPAGGSYSLARIGEPPTCSVSEHATLYRTKRPEAWSPR